MTSITLPKKLAKAPPRSSKKSAPDLAGGVAGVLQGRVQGLRGEIISVFQKTPYFGYPETGIFQGFAHPLRADVEGALQSITYLLRRYTPLRA